MGALIQTRGTRRLVKHYNDIFSSNKLNSTRTTILSDATLIALFDTPNASPTPIRDITQRNPRLFLPPDDRANHPNLLKRWDFFLQYEFHPTNHELLRGFLSKALNLRSGAGGPTGTNQNGDNYVAIQFDCVEAGPLQTQTVLQSDEYKLIGSSHNDDKGLAQNTAYSLIVMVTAPISSNAPPRDNQNFQ